MKLNTRSVVVGVLALASIIAAAVVIQPANIPSASAFDPGICGVVMVGFNKEPLPLNTYPTFTVTGPGGITIPSSRFFPGNGQSFQSIHTTNTGADLPLGIYHIQVEPMAGTSRLISVNGINGNNFSVQSVQCHSQGGIYFYLVYEPPAPQTDGSVLRINPAPQTVQAGHSVFFGVEHSTDNGQNWSDVSSDARSYSPQDVAGAGQSATGLVRHELGGHLSNHEISGVRPGVAQIIALYNGFTASVNLTVTPGAGAPRGPRAPRCVISSNLVATTGGTVRLTYNVVDLPTTITIAADDSSATPPGVPTVGAPGPVHANGEPSGSSGSIDSGPVTKTTVFTMTVTNSIAATTCNVTVTFNASGVLQFQKTLLSMDTVYQPWPGAGLGSQYITQGAYVGNHFVFHGAGCAVGMYRQAPGGQLIGGGLWSINEDGSKIQQRQSCKDGGSVGNSMAEHGSNDGRMYSDEGSDFMFTNSTQGECVQGTPDGGCAAGGPGAKRAVYYGFSGDQVVVRSVHPILGEPEYGRTVETFSGGYAISDNGSVTRLSDWENVGSSAVTRPLVSLGGYIVGRSGTGSGTRLQVYKIQNGQVTEVGELPGNLSTNVGYAYDFSKSPTQLVIRGMGSPPGHNIQPPPARLIWYKAGSSSLEFVKEMSVPSNFMGPVNLGASNFAVLGEYLFLSGGSGGMIVGKATGSTFNKVQTVTFPEGGSTRVILASPSGYVAVESAGALRDNKTQTQVHLYKIGGVSTSTPPAPPGSFPTSTLSQIPGQSLTISTSSTPTTPPKILIRMANILSVSPTSLSLSIFGHNYTVDASQAKTYNMNWALIPFSSFTPGSYVNVWGTLDLQDSTLIHGINIRNPLPPGTQTGTSTVAPFTAPAQTPAQTAATQSQLNTLQEALRALQLRLGQ